MASPPRAPEDAPVARTRRYLAEALVICLGLLATALVFAYARGVEASLAELLFERECQYRLDGIRHAARTHLNALHALGGLYAAGAGTGGEQFAGFAERVLPLQKGLQALEWIPRVPQEGRAAFEAEGRRLHGPDFAIREQRPDKGLALAGARPEYFPVLLAAPLEGNRGALGFDVASDPVRRQTLERARDEGRLLATAPVTLVQDLAQNLAQDLAQGRPDQPGFLAVLPVYQPGTTPSDPAGRQRFLLGFCLAVFRYADMVESTLDEDLPPGVEMRLRDEGAPPDRREVYARRRLPAAGGAEAAGEREIAGTLALGGRSLKVSFVRMTGFVDAQRTWRPWSLALGCLTVAALLALGFGRIRQDMEKISRTSRQLASELALRQKAEAEIMSLARFTSENPDPVLRVDQQGVIIYANPAAGGLLAHWRTTVGRPVPEEWTETVATTLAGGMPRETELTWDTQVYSLLLVPFVQSGYVNLYGRDISVRNRMEVALKDSEERYRNLLEALPLGLVMVDSQRRITHVNQPMISMLDYHAMEMIGRNFGDFVAQADEAAFAAQWERRRRGELAPYELTLTRKDGTSVFAMVYPRPLLSDDGRFQGAFALLTDISQRKILEAQLLQAQKLESIGQLAAGIAHEINTPTQYVTDNTRFLQQSLGDLVRLLTMQGRLIQRLGSDGLYPDQVEEIRRAEAEADLDYLLGELPVSIEQTLEGLERIAKIVRSMKEFAHPGSDTKAPTDLNKAIENTVVVARNEWKYVAEVQTDLDPGLPLVPCVVGEINQVVLNIIVNAAHAIAEVARPGQESKGLIRISTRRDGDVVEIRVADNGPGISQAIRNRVFDPFFTTKEPGKGTGQGLAIAHTVIADKHKGAITFESVEGQGTTFIIRLPLVEGSLERA